MAGARIIQGAGLVLVRNSVDSGQLCLEPGPSLTLALTDGNRAISWLIEVDVELKGTGSFRLGSIVTAPFSVQPPAARIVGMAFCPGAIRWRVWVTRNIGGGDAQAELELSMSQCCPGFVGLVPVPPFAQLPVPPP